MDEDILYTHQYKKSFPPNQKRIQLHNQDVVDDFVKSHKPKDVKKPSFNDRNSVLERQMKRSLTQPDAFLKSRRVESNDEDSTAKQVTTLLHIDSRDRDKVLYPYANDFAIDIGGRMLNNVVRIKLVSCEFPNTSTSIGASNNRISWRNFDEKDTIYTAVIPSGNYNYTSICRQLESSMNAITRTKTGLKHQFSFSIDETSNIMTVYNYGLTVLPPNPIKLTQGSPIAEIAWPDTTLALVLQKFTNSSLKPRLYITNASVSPIMPDSYLDGEFTFDSSTTDSSLRFLMNYTSPVTENVGGFGVIVGLPLRFSFDFSESNSIGSTIGWYDEITADPLASFEEASVLRLGGLPTQNQTWSYVKDLADLPEYPGPLKASPHTIIDVGVELVDSVSYLRLTLDVTNHAILSDTIVIIDGEAIEVADEYDSRVILGGRYVVAVGKLWGDIVLNVPCVSARIIEGRSSKLFTDIVKVSMSNHTNATIGSITNGPLDSDGHPTYVITTHVDHYITKASGFVRISNTNCVPMLDGNYQIIVVPDSKTIVINGLKDGNQGYWPSPVDPEFVLTQDGDYGVIGNSSIYLSGVVGRVGDIASTILNSTACTLLWTKDENTLFVQVNSYYTRSTSALTGSGGWDIRIRDDQVHGWSAAKQNKRPDGNAQKPIILSGDEYVLLCLAGLGEDGLKNTMGLTDVFAKIQLSSIPFQYVFDQFSAQVIWFLESATNIDKLKFSLKRKNGTLFDILGMDYSLVIEITQIHDRLIGTNLATQRPYSKSVSKLVNERQFINS